MDLKILGRLKCLCISICKLLPSRKILYHMNYAGLHGIEKLHLQSLDQLQILFDPDVVVELPFKTLKGTIRPIRVLDDKLLLKFILELPNEFCEKIE